MQIIAATSPEHLATVRGLFEAYAASLQIELCFQNFSAELAGLPGAYAPPRGRLLLAMIDETPAGCVALRPRDAQTCELKRLYVRPEFQGRGAGRMLMTRLISEARALGYTTMLLDTLPSMRGAVKLYESLGFVRRPAYFDSPITGNIFMELSLVRAPA